MQDQPTPAEATAAAEHDQAEIRAKSRAAMDRVKALPPNAWTSLDERVRQAAATRRPSAA